MADVLTSSFMLSSATIMMAPAFTTDVFSLQPSQHSLGMARDIAVNVDSSLIELQNGIAQSTVDARRTGVSAMISANIFEFTAKNFARALALADPNIQIKRGVLASAAAAGAATLSINSDPVPGDAATGITATGDIPSGSTILIQSATDTNLVFPTQTTGAATGTGPYSLPIAAPYAVPTGMSFAVGAKVWIVPPLGIAQVDADQMFGVKIVGTLSNYDRPVVCVFPKVRVQRGFQLSYTETEYGSMPFELKPFLLSATEATGRLADIGVRRPGMVYIGA